MKWSAWLHRVSSHLRHIVPSCSAGGFMGGSGSSIRPPGTGATSGHQKSSGCWPPEEMTGVWMLASGTLTPAAQLLPRSVGQDRSVLSSDELAKTHGHADSSHCAHTKCSQWIQRGQAGIRPAASCSSREALSSSAPAIVFLRSSFSSRRTSSGDRSADRTTAQCGLSSCGLLAAHVRRTDTGMHSAAINLKYGPLSSAQTHGHMARVAPWLFD